MSGHAVMFSGGLCSYLAAKRVKDMGLSPVLLFSDTGIEDRDLYVFLGQASQYLGLELVIVESGESFDQMCERHNAIPNNRMPFCSRELKIAPAEKWLKQHPEIHTLTFGIDWTESHRVPGIEKRWPGYGIMCPMLEPPYLSKPHMIEEVKKDGLWIPRLYKLGMPHNNCGGGCVRAGHAHWKKLKDVFPARFEEWAQREERLGNGHTFNKSRKHKTSKKITLRQLVEIQGDPFDFGGCGCFTEAA